MDVQEILGGQSDTEVSPNAVKPMTTMSTSSCPPSRRGRSSVQGYSPGVTLSWRITDPVSANTLSSASFPSSWSFVRVVTPFPVGTDPSA